MGMIVTLFIVEVFSTILQRIFCDSTLEKRKGSWQYDLLSWGGYFVLFNTISYAITNYIGIAWLNMPAFMVTFFATVKIRYTNPNRTLIVVTLFMYLSGMSAELLTYYGKDLLQWKRIGNEDIFCTVISKIIWFLIIKITSLIVKMSKKTELLMQDWLEVFIVPAGSIWILLSLFVAGILDKSFWGITSVAMIMLINIFTYYLYDKAKENMEKRIKAEMLRRQCSYYIRQEKENKEWWEQIRHFQHDMKQRYIVEKAFLEKKDYTALERYYNENLKFLSRKKNISDTGNIYVDSIINYKADMAEKENIEFVVNINIPSDVELDVEDFCICMGNLLDNAIEAVMDLHDEKSIYVQVNADNSNLFINVKNRYRDGRKKEGKIYLTNKPDEKNHGLGIIIIQQIVGKYDGELIIQDEEGIFDVVVLLYDFLKC
ncbi:MAG: GHKL domain-containing protein [Lachnospiraceae bacterium]|nr:GHKL domain-containing protein [Lachnospiraceae bacterium]